MICDGCSKKAVFKAKAEGKAREKVWCSSCFAKKAIKYAMTAVHIGVLLLALCSPASAATIPSADVSIQGAVSDWGSPYQLANAIDGDPNTFWNTVYYPSPVPTNISQSPYGWIQFSLAQNYLVDGLTYLSRQDGYSGAGKGNIGSYHIFLGTAADCSGTLTEVASGTWADTTSLKTVSWTAQAARCIRLESRLSAAGETYNMNAAEVTFTGLPTAPSVTLTDPSSGYLPGFPTTQALVLRATASVISGSVTKVEFYQGATLLGTDTTSPYEYTWSGASAGTYSVTAKAYGSNGETKTTAATTVIVYSSLTTADADFAARCAASGVIVCNGFDTPSSQITPYIGNDGLGVNRVSQDTTEKVSGAGSMLFSEPAPRHGGANIAGNWLYTFPSNNFVENSTFYVQYRVRYSPEVFSSYDYSGSVTFKTMIIHNHGSSCGAVEFTQNNPNNLRVGWYTQCGDYFLATDPNTGNAAQSGGGGVRVQQIDYTNCTYPSYTTCYKFRPNEWHTFYYKIQVGTWGSANSTFDVWASDTDTYTQKQIAHVPAYLINCNQAPCNQAPGQTAGFDTIQITPYMSGLSAYNGVAGAQPKVWYDELIVSTQPIAWPGTYRGPDKGKGTGQGRGLGSFH